MSLPADKLAAVREKLARHLAYARRQPAVPAARPPVRPAPARRPPATPHKGSFLGV